MNASNQDIEDFDFILSEAIRISNGLKEEGFKEFHEKEYNHQYGSIGMMISSPNGFFQKIDGDPYRQIHLSYESNSRFYLIARRQIKSNRLELIITPEEFVDDLKGEFYNHIFLHNGAFDREGCSKLLNRTFSKSKSKMKNEDYYFPILALGLGVERISIGLGEIIPRKEVFYLASSSIEIPTIKKLEEFCDRNKYSYEHFLKVSISKRSRESRKRVADQVSKFIVGIIKIFSEHFNISPYFISLSTEPYPILDTFNFKQVENEGVDFEFSSRGKIFGSDKFWGMLKENINSDFGTIISDLVNLAIAPKEKSIIADRLIDAIYFFSSALQDNDESSRVVKLTTALERLVSFSGQEDNFDISKNFRERVALLVSIYYDDFSEWEDIAKEMYSIRSSIVHGSWSLYRDIEPLYVSRYSQLTSKAIASACIGFFKLGFTREDDNKILIRFYDFLKTHSVDKNQ